MRRTPTTAAKAAKSANARLISNQAALRTAWEKDVAAGPDGGLRHQWRAATEWLRSEATALTVEQRQQLLDHVIGLCQNANSQARLTVLPHLPGK